MSFRLNRWGLASGTVGATLQQELPEYYTNENQKLYCNLNQIFTSQAFHGMFPRKDTKTKTPWWQPTRKPQFDTIFNAPIHHRIWWFSADFNFQHVSTRPNHRLTVFSVKLSALFAGKWPNSRRFRNMENRWDKKMLREWKKRDAEGRYVKGKA